MRLIFAPEQDEITKDTAAYARHIAKAADTALIGLDATERNLKTALANANSPPTQCIFLGHGNRIKQTFDAWIVDQHEEKAVDANFLVSVAPPACLAYCCHSAFVPNNYHHHALHWWGYTSVISPPVFDGHGVDPIVDEVMTILTNGFSKCSNVNEVEDLIETLRQFECEKNEDAPADVGIFLARIWQYLAVVIPKSAGKIMHKDAVRDSLNWS